MADIEIPEAALDAVLAAYPAHRYPEIALNLHGILGDAAPHIGAAYITWAINRIVEGEGRDYQGDWPSMLRQVVDELPRAIGEANRG